MIPVTIQLPDDIAAQYQSDELARCVLEDFAVQEYAQGRLTLLQLRQLLGLESRYAAHGPLKFERARRPPLACSTQDCVAAWRHTNSYSLDPGSGERAGLGFCSFR